MDCECLLPKFMYYYLMIEVVGQIEVFKKMFSGPWKESESKEVTLPGRSLQAVVQMLGYMYPQTKFELTGKQPIQCRPTPGLQVSSQSSVGLPRSENTVSAFSQLSGAVN